MANWGDYFSEAFNKSRVQRAQEEFDRWKVKQEQPDKDRQRNNAVLDGIKTKTEMGIPLDETETAFVASLRGGQPGMTQPQTLPQPPMQGGGMLPNMGLTQPQIGNAPMGANNIPYVPGDLNPFGQPKSYVPDPIATQKAKDISGMNLKREVLAQDLKSFFAVDDVLQKSRGEGVGRFGAGAEIFAQSIGQNTTLGRAASMHGGASKRLRVQLVRAAGDVGNLNIVEQKAAGEMIPSGWDDYKTAEIKRAYLVDVSRAIDSESESEVKKVIDRFMKEDIYPDKVEHFTIGKKEYYIPKDKVSAFKKAKGIK
jgi:hypothetical protein